jgi:DNA polymerase-1
MEIDWVFIEADKLKWIWILLDWEIRNTKKSIFDEIWEEFNINSPKQVSEILFENLALPRWKKTKNWSSVWVEVLWNLAHDYPIAQKILDYRHFTKIKSTYIDWLLDLLDSNSFIHTSYNTFITSTWRLSSTKPNLQNIPISDGIAWEIRDAFISRFNNWKILAFDYSQVEVRILAIMSEDKNLIDAFNNWHDIHHKTAEFIFWKGKITNNERKIAKAVNFWVIYWLSPFWLSKMIWIPVKEAKIYIDKFFESYPNVKIFLEKIIKKAEKNNYVETLFWRRRYIKWINDQNRLIKAWAEREAINMPIQWTSADVIKIAMIKIHDFLKKNKLKSKMIMQVHDELVFDTFSWEEKILEKEVTYIMENVLKDKPVKLKIEIWEGNSWRDAK